MPTWIDWFLCEPDGYLFVPVDRDFIAAESRSAEIRAKFKPAELSAALAVILGDDKNHKFDNEAKLLYGLIHRRYLSTPKGLALMFERHRTHSFPPCSRYLCRGFTCLPCGLSDQLDNVPVHLFCPNCTDFYECRHQPADGPIPGAFFGKKWVHMFMERYTGVAEKPPEVHEPRVFGFRVHLQQLKPAGTV
jgi:casein kinase II subunit beta